MRFIADGRGDLKKTFGPEDVFSYIYAVLYSPTYRERYAEFLRIDFPRVPITSNVKLFRKMRDCGKALVDLHLLKSAELDTPIARFQGEGGNRVEKLRYDEKKKHLHINESQYFEGIAKEVWEYQVGGYQVASKWLKDRKKRILSLNDIKHYCKVITALQKTMEIQKTIDALYPEVEKETVGTI
jgi:predicted helicase